MGAVEEGVVSNLLGEVVERVDRWVPGVAPELLVVGCVWAQVSRLEGLEMHWPEGVSGFSGGCPRFILLDSDCRWGWFCRLFNLGISRELSAEFLSSRALCGPGTWKMLITLPPLLQVGGGWSVVCYPVADRKSEKNNSNLRIQGANRSRMGKIHGSQLFEGSSERGESVVFGCWVASAFRVRVSGQAVARVGRSARTVWWCGTSQLRLPTDMSDNTYLVVLMSSLLFWILFRWPRLQLGRGAGQDWSDVVGWWWSPSWQPDCGFVVLGISQGCCCSFPDLIPTLILFWLMVASRSRILCKKIVLVINSSLLGCPYYCCIILLILCIILLIYKDCNCFVA